MGWCVEPVTHFIFIFIFFFIFFFLIFFPLSPPFSSLLGGMFGFFMGFLFNTMGPEPHLNRERSHKEQVIKHFKDVGRNVCIFF